MSQTPKAGSSTEQTPSKNVSERFERVSVDHASGQTAVGGSHNVNIQHFYENRRGIFDCGKSSTSTYNFNDYRRREEITVPKVHNEIKISAAEGNIGHYQNNQKGIFLSDNSGKGATITYNED